SLDRGLDLDLRQEVDDVLGSSVQLGVTLLPTKALDLGDGDALHADCGQRFAHLVKLERLDDCGNELHVCSIEGNGRALLRPRDAVRTCRWPPAPRSLGSSCYRCRWR